MAKLRIFTQYKGKAVVNPPANGAVVLSATCAIGKPKRTLAPAATCSLGLPIRYEKGDRRLMATEYRACKSQQLLSSKTKQLSRLGNGDVRALKR